MPSSLDSTKAGGEASDSPRPSRRWVEPWSRRVPAGIGYLEASNDAPTASARPSGARTRGPTGAGARTPLAVPSGPVKVSPARSTGALPTFQSSTYSPSLRGDGPGGDAITSEMTTVGSGESVVTRCDSPTVL